MTVSFGRLSAARAAAEGRKRIARGSCAWASRGQRRGSPPHGGVEGGAGPPVRRPLPERLGRVLRCAVCACAQCFFIRKKPEAVNPCPRQAAGPQGTPRPIPGLWHAAKWARLSRMENRTTPPSTPSLARRYICKLLANVASVPVYLAMEAILPRALGPAMYGNYSFATNFFQQL